MLAEGWSEGKWLIHSQPVSPTVRKHLWKTQEILFFGFQWAASYNNERSHAAIVVSSSLYTFMANTSRSSDLLWINQLADLYLEEKTKKTNKIITQIVHHSLQTDSGSTLTCQTYVL